ncbi:MAG: hypothetical protein OHK0039_11230 [Bacteroidia bacterium]
MKPFAIACTLLLLVLVSCIPDPVPITVPQAEARLVVASQMLPGNFVLVNVSRSFGALEYDPDQTDTLGDDLLARILVDSARVVLAWPGGTDTLLPLGAGSYLSLGHQVQGNQTYELHVFDSLTGQEVRAATVVLPQVPLGELSYRFEYVRSNILDTFFTDTLLHLDVQFEDPAGANYYMLNAYRFSLPDSNSLSRIFTGGSGIPTTIISDQILGGPRYRDTLTYNQFRPGDTLAVALSNIDRGYYEYLATRERSGTSLFAILLREPVNFPSNVVGGYGYFTLQLPSLNLILLE